MACWFCAPAAFLRMALRVIRDTTKRTGGAARAAGILLTTAGVLMALLPVAMVLLMMWAMQ